MNIKNLLNLDKFLFIKLNFNKKVKGRIIPYKGTKIELGENSKLNVGKKMFINSEKLKNSNKETYILIKKNAEIKIEEFFDKINDPYIPTKEKRPVFFCIQDKKNSELWWVIPMTSQLDKANKFIKKYDKIKL